MKMVILIYHKIIQYEVYILINSSNPDKLQDENGQFKLQYTTEGLHITEIGYYHITMELLKYFK